MSRIKAVICDLDGLLFDSERRTRRSWQAGLARLGHEMSDEFYTTLIGRKIAMSENMVAEYFSVSLDDFRPAWRDEHKRLVESGPVDPRPGAVTLMQYLHAQQIPRAIATSSNRHDALHTLGEMADYFPVIITGDQVTLGKPHPEIYLKAAAAIGIDPLSCVALEDSEPGIAAAHAAGMQALMIPDLKQPTSETKAIAAAIFNSLDEALQHIQQSLA